MRLLGEDGLEGTGLGGIRNSSEGVGEEEMDMRYFKVGVGCEVKVFI